MKIPVTLGDLINLLNESIQDGTHSAVDYFASLKEPVLELIKLYILQVSCCIKPEYFLIL